MGRPFLIAVCLLVGCAAAFLGQVADQLLPGVVVSRVVCSGNPQQSYAFYLPTTYSAGKKWPIIYAFDPGARGQVAVESIRAAAEKFGYIVVGSNNSRNGAEAASAEAASAMWQDTQQRFRIDEQRRYFAGMSGGARVATALAISCKGCVAGVIANAAGFPQGKKPSSELKFAYFAGLGNADFNFVEFVDLRRDLEGSGMPYRIRTFEGQHGWAPAEVWQEALNWMDIQAMRAGTIPRDADRIQQSYEGASKRAEKFRSDKEFLDAFREAKFAAHEFTGLIDVRSAQEMIAELEKDKRVKGAEKREGSAALQQRELMADLSAQMDALAQEGLGAGDFMALRDGFTMLLKQVRKPQDAEDATTLVRRRALSGLVVQSLESGQSALNRKQYDVALRFFDLAVAGSNNPGWAHFQRARVYGLIADRKHVIAELRQALAGGFSDPSALSSQEFQAFQGDSEFQAIARAWSKRDTRD